MGDPYGLPDLRQLLARRTHFPVAKPQATEPFFVHRNLIPPPPPPPSASYHNGTIMVGHEFMSHTGFGSNYIGTNTSTTTNVGGASTTSGVAVYGVDMENSGWQSNVGNEGINNSRWPRQETLTLLEIRSRLDSKFKEANQKGPLWDEVARIMVEEHGYQRSGKKCREKFENLYKYYKKTKDGKAGRQDGKHYRFFRQLEALYGEASNQASTSTQNAASLPYHQAPYNYTTNNNNNNNNQLEKQQEQSLSFSNSQSAEFETSSSETNTNDRDDLSAIAFIMNQKQKMTSVNDDSAKVTRRNNLKAKVKELVDSQMRKLMETQEAWMEKMLKTIEDREQERVFREEEWRKQEVARLDQEHEFWSKERAWVEARDAMLMESLKTFVGKKGVKESPNIATMNDVRWSETEISSLIQLKNSLEPRFQHFGYLTKEGFWVELAAKMATLGYGRSAIECKEKWESMQMYFDMATECYKKRKEDLRTSSYYF